MSQLALNLIKKNIRTKNPVLDLGNCGLTELYPKLLNELAKTVEWLEVLRLCDFWVDAIGRCHWSSENNGPRNVLQNLPTHLPKFKLLHTIVLNSNKINNCSPLSEITSLKALYLNSNGITDCSPLIKLNHLVILDISQNSIENCEPISNLKELKFLSIFDNPIKDSSPLLSLASLLLLYISNVKFDWIWLSKFKNIQRLTVSATSESDCVHLLKLKALRMLSINDEQPKNLNLLGKFKNLEILGLHKIAVDDWAFLRKLTNLTHLSLLSTGLRDCSEIVHLKKLVNLNILWNNIEYFPFRIIDELQNLEGLYLAGNPIANIEKAVYEREKNMATNVLQEVKDFIKDLRKSSTNIYTSKLIVIGNGRVGKTCLLKRWLDDTFNEKEDSTHAIQLRQHRLGKLAQAKGLENIMLNIWDFGGQDIYHATHRIFLKTNAIFLLAWDTAMENAHIQTEVLHDGQIIHYHNQKLHYWLSYIKTLSRNSPVLLVQTKAGTYLKDATIAPMLTTEEMAYFNVKGQISVESSDTVTNGFANLQEKIETLVHEQVLTTCTKLPTAWHKVRQTIEQKRDNGEKRIKIRAFMELCKQQGLDKSSTHTLLQYLHDTGVLFYQEGLFGNQLVIDQQWAIDAIYILFDRSKPFFKQFRNNGFFKGNDLKEVWQRYSEVEQELFVSFMQKCLVCVEIDAPKEWQAKKPFNLRQYLAPQLLPNNGDAIKLLLDDLGGPTIIYEASFLHPAVIQQIIVQLAFLSNPYNMWVDGIIIKTNEGKALIEAHGASNKLLVQLHQQANISLLKTLQKVIDKSMLYDEELEILVSLDGQIFVNLAKLQKDLVTGTPILSTCGKIVEANAYRIFLKGINGLDDIYEEKEKDALNYLRPVATEKAAVFFSYKWKDAANDVREEIVDVLYNTLSKDMQSQIITHRDRQDVKYGDSISNYMKQISRGRHIFVFISDKYLCSAYCMLELHGAYAANCWDTDLLREVIYPVRVENISLNNIATRDRYARFWDGEIAELEAYIESDKANRPDSDEQKRKLKRMREDLDRLLLFLADICTPDTIDLSDNNFEKVKAEIQRRLHR